MRNKLTPKQLKFCLEYQKSGNATEAAIKAGYNKKTAYSIGSENLTKPEIKSYIEANQKKLEAKALVTIEELVNDLKTLKARCMQAEQVLDREGNPTGEYKFDSHGATKSIELLGKHLGMFIERTEHKIDQSVTVFNVLNKDMKEKVEKLNNSINDL